jgi:circadian clock protein KaiB
MAADESLNNSAAEYEQLAAESVSGRYELYLYISGMTPRSTEAINNLTAICALHFADESHFSLHIIDLYKHPEMAKSDHIIATPTLIKRQPAPLRRLIGTLTDKSAVLAGLDLARR